ncbi:hypothetical protein SAMN05444050_1607 [Afipia sp. GAS231]|nr:hypothetical protein SAMN05444050_1607 [Afipia sp. GAS231]
MNFIFKRGQGLYSASSDAINKPAYRPPSFA